MDDEACRLKRTEPFIIVAESDEVTEYMVYVESQFLVSTTTLGDALANLMCTYFVFDIVYPKLMYPLLVFLQHTLMGIKDTQKLPTSVRTVLTSLY